MTRKRAHIPLKEKLAAIIREHFQIPFEDAKRMDVEQMLSLVQWHHSIPHAPPFNGPDKHWNLVPTLIKAHREETAKHDVPMIYKTRRGIAKRIAHQAIMDAKAGRLPDGNDGTDQPDKARQQARGFAKRKCPMPGSRNHPSKLRRRMNGKVTKWK